MAMASEMQVLRSELERCGDDTKELLAPILSVTAVQNLLLSCVQDTSRSLDEWVWEPSVRQLLTKLREQHKSVAHADTDHLNALNMEHVRTHMQSLELEEETAESLMQQIHDLRDKGRRLFQTKDFYPAMTKYQKCVELFERFYQEDGATAPIEFELWTTEMLRSYVACCCNIAVCGIKRKDLSTIKRYADKVCLLLHCLNVLQWSFFYPIVCASHRRSRRIRRRVKRSTPSPRCT